MNGAECGACGYITCECDRIAREAEVTKDKQIKELEAELKAKDAEIERLKASTSICVGIIRASAQVNTKLLADKLEQALKGKP